MAVHVLPVRKIDDYAAIRYAFALLMVLLATLVRLFLEALLQGQAPFLTYVLAVMAATVFGGLRPGLLAGFLSAFTVVYLFVPPANSLRVQSTSDLFSLLLFCAVAVVTVMITNAQQVAHKRSIRLVEEAEVRQRELEAEIQARNLAEARLQVALREYERSNRELQEFAFVSSHDLQEPLRKIQAFGDRLIERAGPTLDSESISYLARMQNASNRMQTLINDLLDLSRVTSRAEPFKPTPLDDVLREVLDDLQMMTKRTGAVVESTTLPVIEADRLQMKQLFQNLIANAIKFQPPGGKPRVEIASKTLPQGLVEIHVKDNGIGMKREHQEKIFQVFQRLHGRDEYEGSGIGLSICRRIVERHQGEIGVVSEPGKGSTFTVRLPVSQP